MKQKKKTNRKVRGIILTIISFIALVLPIGILMIWKKNEWFAYQIDGTKVSMGFIIALIFAICLLKDAFKNLDKRFTTLFSLLIMAVITWLLDSILVDLTLILLCAVVGYVAYLIVNLFAKKDLDYSKAYVNEKARVDARKEAEESVGNV